MPVEVLFDAFVDERARGRWLAGAQLRVRTATRPRSARFDWGDDGTRVSVIFQTNGEAASVVAVEHTRLADAAAADDMKNWWRARLTALKSGLEGGGRDA